MLTAVDPLRRTRGAVTLAPPHARPATTRPPRPAVSTEPQPPGRHSFEAPGRSAGRHHVPGDAPTPGTHGRHERPATTPLPVRVGVALRDRISYLALAAVAIVGVLHLSSDIATPFGTWGDGAVVELMVRRAARFEQYLGPYSRFGWSHPGPAWFYALAPFESLFGTRGLFLGSWALNMAAAACTVWAVRRRAGEWAARWAVVVLAVAMLCVPSFDLWNPWNPSALALPIVTMAVLTAATWQGSRLSFAGAVLAGSFLVQTHVGMVPLVAATMCVAVAGLVGGRAPANAVAHDRGPSSPRWRRALWWTAAFAAVVLVWIPPVSEQALSEGDTGNVSRLAAFAADPVGRTAADSGHPTAQQAFVAVTRQIGSFPLGRDLWPGESLNRAPLDAGRLVAAVAWLLLAAAVITFGWGRNRFAVALAAWTVVMYPVAFLSAMNISGPVFQYLLWWTAALPVPAVIGAGALVATTATESARARRTADGPDPIARRAATAVVCVALLAATAVPLVSLTSAVRATDPQPFAPEPAGDQTADILEARYAGFLPDGVLVVPWAKAHPIGSSLVIALDRRGIAASVPVEELYQFGERSRPTRDERIAVVIADPGDDPRGAIGPTAEQIARVGEGDRYVVWVVTR